MKSKTPRQSQTKGPRQFSLKMALLITLVVAIACATWGGLSRGESDRTLFLFFGVTAPFGVLLLLGLVHQLMKYRR
ncbi:MAG: hypothetical protein MK161_04535 [Pirellulales bacterium]|nr:hypothetical protein [Pirellulales bacterium]